MTSNMEIREDDLKFPEIEVEKTLKHLVNKSFISFVSENTS